MMVEASVHTQLAVLASVKLRMAEQVNWLAPPALFVATLKVTTTEIPALLKTAETSWGTSGILIPATSVVCTVGPAVGFRVGAVVGATVGISVGFTEGPTVGFTDGGTVGTTLG